jgi:hypothetical protein
MERVILGWMLGRRELLLSAACFFDIIQLLLFWVSWRKNKQRLGHEIWFDAYPRTRVDHVHAWRKSAIYLAWLSLHKSKKNHAVDHKGKQPTVPLPTYMQCT